jgi:hypothetical protein
MHLSAKISYSESRTAILFPKKKKLHLFQEHQNYIN